MVDNIKPITESIKKDGYSTFEDIIARREAEKFFVDFKLTQNSDYSQQRTLFDSDRNNFAKAISGFGNSEGGLIIWGIDASGRVDDYAKSIKPIQGVDNFVSLLETFVSLSTLPAHTSVESFAVKKKKSDKEGVVVSVIPKSNDRPFQSLRDHKYYMRAGDSFVPVPHGVLQGMFGRAPQPDVYWMYNINRNPTIGPNKEMEFQVGLMGVNGGLGIGEDIFGFARAWNPGNASQIGVDLTDTQNYDFYKAYGVEFSFMSKQGFRLGYHQRTQMLVMNFFLLPPFTDELYIKILIGGRNQQVYSKVIKKTPEQLTTIYNKFIKEPTMDCIQDIWDLENQKNDKKEEA